MQLEMTVGARNCFLFHNMLTLESIAWGRSRGGRQGRGGSCLGGAGSGGSCAGQGFRLYFYERSQQLRSCGYRTSGGLDRWSQQAKVRPRLGKLHQTGIAPWRRRARTPSPRSPAWFGPSRRSLSAPDPWGLFGDCHLALQGSRKPACLLTGQPNPLVGYAFLKVLCPLLLEEPRLGTRPSEASWLPSPVLISAQSWSWGGICPAILRVESAGCWKPERA